MVGADISIELNDDTFTLADSQELEERLRAETDLQIESYVGVYAFVEGQPPPPDVVIYFLHTIVPFATGVFMNVLSSALWDKVNAAVSRQNREDSEANFHFAVRDEKDLILREVSGRTDDREIIKDLICRTLEDDEQ